MTVRMRCHSDEEDEIIVATLQRESESEGDDEDENGGTAVLENEQEEADDGEDGALHSIILHYSIPQLKQTTGGMKARRKQTHRKHTVKLP
ncbi:hypothetical protein MHYP_G00330740 [Metynnis hypsauchen]